MKPDPRYFLPVDLIYPIVRYCDAQTVLAICTINKTWYQVCIGPETWKQLFKSLRISQKNVSNYIQTYRCSVEHQLIPVPSNHEIELSQNNNMATNKNTNSYTRLRKCIHMFDLLSNKVKNTSMSYHFRVETLPTQGWVSVGYSKLPNPTHSEAERHYGATIYNGLELTVKNRKCYRNQAHVHKTFGIGV